MAKSLFRLNGECGYVLKPEWMRLGGLGSGVMDGPTTLLTVTIISAQLLPKSRARDTVISPYVQVTCVGNKVKLVKRSDYVQTENPGAITSADFNAVSQMLPHLPDLDEQGTMVEPPVEEVKDFGYEASFMTKTIAYNGFAPVFVTENPSDYQVSFLVQGPETAFLMLDIYNNVNKGVDEPVALWVGRVMDLRRGYRALRLDSASGGKVGGSSLFVNIEVVSVASETVGAPISVATPSLQNLALDPVVQPLSPIIAKPETGPPI
jgi:hypothetical protein